MTHADWFQTLAEIGLGFAGFSALIAGMRRGEQTPDPENTSRGRAVVETSLSVLFACALPALLIGLGIAETTAFRMAGGLFLLAGTPLSIRGFRRAIKTRSAKRTSQPALTMLSVTAGTASLFFSLACVIGQPEELVPTYYFGALLGTLSIAGINFMGFVLSIDE